MEMNLMDIYNLMVTRQLTEEEVAKVLGFTPTTFKLRCAKWGHRLPLLLATLDKIRRDEISRDEAAETLNVSVRNVNALMKSWNVSRPLRNYIVDRTASKVKWEIRKKFAIEYIADQCTIEEAAENAGVSTRQIRRWVSELLDKHFGMVFKDLAQVASHKRKRLADDIEVAEGLELAKQNVLNQIVKGQKTVREEALDRVLARRTIRGRTTPHA